MTGANQQIVEAFETLEMSPEQIAEELGYEVAAVKAVLAQNSKKFRGESREAEGLNFTDEDLKMVNNGIREIAMSAEDDHLRLRACMYIRDDKKGRLDAIKSLTGLNVNVVMINAQMKKAQEAIARAKQKVKEITDKDKVVDV